MSNTGDVLDKWACSSDNPYLMAIADRNLTTEALLAVLVFSLHPHVFLPPLTGKNDFLKFEYLNHTLIPFQYIEIYHSRT